MTDKEKIKAEIEKRIELNDKRLERFSEEDFTCSVASDILAQRRTYSLMLSFIESMEEEPVSDDLEEAADFYSNLFSDIAAPYIRKDAFIAGAKWQQEQFERNRLAACDALTEEQYKLETGFIDSHIEKNNRTPTFIDAIEYGMKLQKEQILKGKVNMYLDLMGGICIKNKWLIEAMKAANIEKGSMVYIVVVPKED